MSETVSGTTPTTPVDYYTAAILELSRDDSTRSSADGVLKHAFMLIGQDAFNETLQGLFEFSEKYDKPSDDNPFGLFCCEGFHRTFRQADVCDRFPHKGITSARPTHKKHSDKPAIDQVSINGTVDMLVWHALHLESSWPAVMIGLGVAYQKAKAGEEINLDRIFAKARIQWDDIVDARAARRKP